MMEAPKITMITNSTGIPWGAAGMLAPCSRGSLAREGLVDHPIGLQPQAARQILSSLFRLFLAGDQENLRPPDRARAFLFAFGDRCAKAGAGLLDRQADDHGSVLPLGPRLPFCPGLPLGSGQFSDRVIRARANSSHGSRITRPRLAQGAPFGSLAS